MTARRRARLAAAAVAVVVGTTGCATVTVPVGYAPAPSADGGDGARTVTVAPSFRIQAGDEPVFTVTFLNGAAEPVAFGPDRVRAFFRGRPTPLATRVEKLAQARAGERGRELGELVLGVVAVGAALYGIANPSLVAVRPSAGGAPVTEVVRVADPTAVAIAVAAAGGGAEVAAASNGRAADIGRASPDAMLRPVVVAPGQRVAGQVVLANCCGGAPTVGDVVRIEVDVAPGDVRAFEFARVAAADSPALLPLARASPWPAGGGTIAAPNPAAGGQDGWSVERLARAQGCHPAPVATLAAKGPGFETWTVACTNGDALAVRCDFGTCRALR